MITKTFWQGVEPYPGTAWRIWTGIFWHFTGLWQSCRKKAKRGSKIAQKSNHKRVILTPRWLFVGQWKRQTSVWTWPDFKPTWSNIDWSFFTRFNWDGRMLGWQNNRQPKPLDQFGEKSTKNGQKRAFCLSGILPCKKTWHLRFASVALPLAIFFESGLH